MTIPLKNAPGIIPAQATQPYAYRASALGYLDQKIKEQQMRRLEPQASSSPSLAIKKGRPTPSSSLLSRLDGIIANQRLWMKEKATQVERVGLPLADITEWLAPYQIVHYFNIQSVAEASLYLIAEKHMKDHRMAASFIHFLASEGPLIILYESCESGIMVSEEIKKSLLQTQHIDPSYGDNIFIFGWDVADEVWDDEKAHIQSLSAQLRAIDPELLHAPDTLEYGGEHIDLSRFWALTSQQFKMASPLISDLITTQEQAFDRTFPARTAAMVSSLQQLDRIKASAEVATEPKVVLIAGRLHLVTSEKNSDNPNYELSTLYHELQNHEAVILSTS